MNFNFKDEDLIIKPYKAESPIYVRKQKGTYQKVRRITGVILMLMFLFLPWLTFNGHQAILLDIEKQQFHFFSQTFYPQDFTLVASALIVSAFLLFFITTLFGRLWCGYLCPQTVWTFMYMWVEEKIEGSRNQRIKYDKAGYSLTYISKKVLKHSVWILLSLISALTFISYFFPVKQFYIELITFESSFVVVCWVAFFTLCTYANAGWLREKMCIYMCPYSRFQSVMFDANTVVVTYNAERGENRGIRKIKDDPKALGKGDCVDCNLCVEVCPVGIDIRNGLQYECINCGACVDACNQTMKKFNYPKNLISYTNEAHQPLSKINFLRPKVLAYGVISLLFVGAMSYFFIARSELELIVIRDRNALYNEQWNNDISNAYLLKITNKSQREQHYSIGVNVAENNEEKITNYLTVQPGENLNLPVTVTLPVEQIHADKMPINFVVYSKEADERLFLKETFFYAPAYAVNNKS